MPSGLTYIFVHTHFSRDATKAQSNGWKHTDVSSNPPCLVGYFQQAGSKGVAAES
jgi:hypothetical protein